MHYPKFAPGLVALVALAATAAFAADITFQENFRPALPVIPARTFTLVKLPPKPSQGEH
ncbi:MAG TPA: hypothetical protein VKC51_04615 [Lacunisphaera sp.]|nr:hypothetical protein [Lacunisphaera sp.]